MFTKEDFNKDLYFKCLNELYEASQPSITFDQIINKSKADGEAIYKQHYLSNEECKYIIDKYVDLYNLDSKFKDHCDLLIRDIVEGCSKDKYIKPNGDKPGYRSYEKVPPLEEIIGKEAANKVIEFIKMRKDFYRFERQRENFEFNMWNFSPCSNKQTVIDYWKSQGIDIKIEDRDPTYNYERYYQGASEEEIAEIKKELERENNNE